MQYGKTIRELVKQLYHICLSLAIVCSALEELENGQIMYDVDNETDFVLDMVARLTCNRGFSLNGNDTRACMDDDQADTIGVWSEEMPSCQGGFI